MTKEIQNRCSPVTRLGLLAVSALITLAIYALVYRTHARPETGRNYIYGFGIRSSQRSFFEYLRPITAEGLREVRWDHVPRPLVTVACATASTWTVVSAAYVASSATCVTSPAATYVRY